MSKQKVCYSIKDVASSTLNPQMLYFVGAYDKEKKADFALRCWVTFCWDEELSVVCSMTKTKTTCLIDKSKVFSLGLVTESLLPYADYFGHKSGFDNDKMDIPIELEKGRVLDVPIIADCPWTYELQVKSTKKTSGSTIYICTIKNILVNAELIDESLSGEERMKMVAPAHYIFGTKYYSWSGKEIGEDMFYKKFPQLFGNK